MSHQPALWQGITWIIGKLLFPLRVTVRDLNIHHFLKPWRPGRLWRGRRTPKPRSVRLTYDTLEPRLVPATPSGLVPDTYSVIHDHTLTETSVTGVLSNDWGWGAGALTVTGVNGNSAAVGNATTLPSKATLTLNSDGSLTYVPYAAAVYDDSFNYSATDGTHSASTVVTIHVTNAIPVANDDALSTDENTPLTIAQSDLTSNDTDADGDLLTVTDFTQPTNGSVSFVGASLVYTPNTYYHGSDSFTYSINDGVGGIATATVNLTVNHVNQPPTPQPDSANVALDTAATIDVLANDTDPDGDSLTVTAVTDGSHGTAIVSSNQVVYTPATGYAGPDQITYTVSDGSLTATATVVLTVGNGQWASSVISESSSWLDDGPYEWYAVQALGSPNTFDYGDEPTAWAPETEDGGQEYLALGFQTPDYANGLMLRETYGNGFITQVDLLDDASPPAYHTVWTGTDPSTAGSPANFQISFTTTTYQVTGVRLTVNTGHGIDAWEEIDAVWLMNTSSHASTNSAPTLAANPATTSVDENSSVNIPISSLASDPDGDPFLVSITGEPTNGDVEIDDNGTPDDLSDDFLTYTPAEDTNGTDSFTYQVTDIYGASVTGSVNVTINHVYLTPDAEDDNAATDKNTAVAISVLANDSDLNNDTLTVSSVSTPSHGTTSESGGVITYTPATDFTGIDQFNYTISNGGLTATAQVTVLVYETGQWASSVVSYSSQFDPQDGSTDWAATQALGVPDTFTYDDNSTAWTPANINDPSNTTPETLTVGFTTPALATGVVVRETYGNGFVTQVELQDTSNTWYTLWSASGSDVDPSQPGKPTDMILSFPATSYYVQAVRITADTTQNAGEYDEIDAVRLLTGGSPSSVTLNGVAVNQAPTATDVWASPNEGQTISIPVLDYASDPDGDALTVSIASSPAHGSASVSSGVISYTPTSGYNGSDSLTYSADDGFGGTATATVHFTVADGQWANQVLAYSSQADNGSYGSSVFALGPPDTPDYGDTSLSWSPNPSSTATSDTLTLGVASADYATGVLIRESSGNGFVTQVELQDTLSTWHTVWTPGTDSTPEDAVQDFLVTLGSTTSYQVQAVRITVNPTTTDGNPVGIDAVKLLTSGSPPSLPTAPVAADDSASTAENMPVNINVLSNDTNTAGSQLFLTITNGLSNGTAAVDLHGTSNDSSDDFITYWPDQDFSGTDSFTYTLTDAYGHISSATVSLTVSAVNQAPTAGMVSAVTTPTTAVALALLTNASDPDGDTLTVSSVGSAQNGTVSLTGATATYTPDSGFTGEDEFSFTISDGNGHTDVGLAQVLVYDAGQWASSVIAVSSGRDSADAVLGATDDTPWTPDGTTAQEFLTVGFASSAYATGVLVRDENGSGGITQVDLIDTSGTAHTIWSGTDPASGSAAVDFVLNFATTAYQVQEITIYSSGTEIDAVRLLTGGTASSLTVEGRGFDGNGNYVDTTFNTAGQPTTTKTYEMGSLIQTEDDMYDTDGNLTTQDVTDANSNTTRTAFDSNGNKTAEIAAYGTAEASETDYTYNTDGELTQVEDPDGNITGYGYTHGEQTSITDPLDNVTEKTYDTQGRVASVTNPDGAEIVYSYDAAGRESGEVWYANDGVTVVDTKDFAYNAQGLLETASNNIGTYTYDYDDQGRVIEVEEPFGVTLDFGYDANGNRNLVKDSLGGEEDSLYNAENQLVTRWLTQGSTVLRLDFTYTAGGQIATIKRYSDTAGTDLVATTVYTYDLLGNVTGIQSKDASGTTIDEFDYVYDLAGNLTSETDNGTPIDYSYDDQGQLTGDGTSSYNYDANGNQTYSGVTTPWTGNQVTTDGVWNYSFNNEGNEWKKVNISTGETWTYGYDNKNQLIWAEDRVSDGGTLISRVDYKYDVFGNRVEKDIDSDGDGAVDTVQRYALDGWNPAKGTPVGNENWEVWADLDGSNNLQTHYLTGDVVDQLFARIDKSGSTLTPYWMMTDHLGSVRDVVDDSGDVQASVAYDSFGNATINGSNTATVGRYLWTGREFDTETGLQYNRGRYYDSGTGRWISQDPMGFEAGDSNLYRYVRNSPILNLDPSGFQQTSERRINRSEAALVAIFLQPVFKLTNKELNSIFLNTRFSWNAKDPNIVNNLGNGIAKIAFYGEAVAITLPPFLTGYPGSAIYWKKGDPMGFTKGYVTAVKDSYQVSVIAHEFVHVVQEMRWPSKSTSALFGSGYIFEYLQDFAKGISSGLTFDQAYGKIPFEEVAYQFQYAISDILEDKGFEIRFDKLINNYNFIQQHVVATSGYSDGKFDGIYDKNADAKLLRDAFLVDFYKRLKALPENVRDSFNKYKNPN